MPNQKSDDRSSQQGNKGSNPGQQSGQGQSGSRGGDSGTRDNRVERTVVISKVSKAGKVNKAGHRIAIAKNKKATCLIVIASRASKASRKKLLQAVTPHHITMTRIQNAQKTKLQTGIRILTAA